MSQGPLAPRTGSPLTSPYLFAFCSARPVPPEFIIESPFRPRPQARPAASQARPAGAYWKEDALPRGPMAETPATRACLPVRLRDPRDEGAWAERLD